MALPDEPAWPLVRSWSAEAGAPHRLIEAEDAVGEATLAAFDGLTERSVLGALARHCAALVVDDWLVVVGAGGDGYPGLRELNGPEAPHPIGGAMVVGLDVMGGGFAINGGGLDCGEPGEVCFLGADDLRWMACELGHSAFVRWALGGQVDEFYADARWTGWRDDVASLQPGQAIAAYPPAWSAEGRGENVHRAPVPMQEAWGLTQEFARRIGAAPDQ